MDVAFILDKYFCKEEYGKECDNEQVGGGPACADNASRLNTAKLYVVFR